MPDKARGRERSGAWTLGLSGTPESSALGAGGNKHTQVSVPEASDSHFSCFFANLRGNSEDAGGLFHDPDQQVVDVVFQLAHLTLLLAYRFLLFEDKLDQLVVGQLCISKRGFRGLVFLWEVGRKVIKSVKESNILKKYKRGSF